MIYEEGDYFGGTVNIAAARIAAQAGADQVFVGEDLVRVIEPSDFVLRDLGGFDLKGISRPIRIYEVKSSGDESDPSSRRPAS
jgi:class 3 adenylate cyclase